MNKKDARDRGQKTKQLLVHIPEATGKRVRKLSVEGPPDAGLNDWAVAISFEDDTHIFIELSALLRAKVSYERTIRGELQTIKEYPARVVE